MAFIHFLIFMIPLKMLNQNIYTYICRFSWQLRSIISKLLYISKLYISKLYISYIYKQVIYHCGFTDSLPFPIIQHKLNISNLDHLQLRLERSFTLYFLVKCVLSSWLNHPQVHNHSHC